MNDLHVAAIVPGFSSCEEETFIPAVSDTLRAVHETGVSVTVFTLRYPFRTDSYTWRGVPVESFGGWRRGTWLLPALPAIIALMVIGWQALLRPLPARAQALAWRGLALGAVLAAWVMPLATLIPTYLTPRPLAGGVDVPAVYTFGEAIRVIGHQTPPEARPGETLRVDTGCLVAFESTVTYDIQMVAGIKTAFFGGEGLFYAELTGPGMIWLQSLPFKRVAKQVLSAIPRGKGEGSALGGLGDLIMGGDR